MSRYMPKWIPNDYESDIPKPLDPISARSQYPTVDASIMPPRTIISSHDSIPYHHMTRGHYHHRSYSSGGHRDMKRRERPYRPSDRRNNNTHAYSTYPERGGRRHNNTHPYSTYPDRGGRREYARDRDLAYSPRGSRDEKRGYRDARGAGDNHDMMYDSRRRAFRREDSYRDPRDQRGSMRDHKPYRRDRREYSADARGSMRDRKLYPRDRREYSADPRSYGAMNSRNSHRYRDSYGVRDWKDRSKSFDTHDPRPRRYSSIDRRDRKWTVPVVRPQIITNSCRRCDGALRSRSYDKTEPHSKVVKKVVEYTPLNHNLEPGTPRVVHQEYYQHGSPVHSNPLYPNQQTITNPKEQVYANAPNYPLSKQASRGTKLSKETRYRSLVTKPHTGNSHPHRAPVSEPQNHGNPIGKDVKVHRRPKRVGRPKKPENHRFLHRPSSCTGSLDPVDNRRSPLSAYARVSQEHGISPRIPSHRKSVASTSSTSSSSSSNVKKSNKSKNGRVKSRRPNRISSKQSLDSRNKKPHKAVTSSDSYMNQRKHRGPRPLNSKSNPEIGTVRSREGKIPSNKSNGSKKRVLPSIPSGQMSPVEVVRKERRASHDLFPDWHNPAHHGHKVAYNQRRRCC